MSSLFTAPGEPASAEPVSVLIVDDDEGTRDSLLDIFRGMGYCAVTAGDGAEALRKVRGEEFDLALLDIHLPDMTGTDLLGRLKEIVPETICVIATGHASMQSSIDALNRGAYAYITKPVDIGQVTAIFRQALDKQRLERENRRLLDELTALSRLTDTALTTLDLDELLARLLEGVTSYMKTAAGAILLLDERGNLMLRSAIGLNQDVERRQDVRSGRGLVSQVVAERRPLVVHAPDLWEQDESVGFRDRGIQSALGVPLESRGQLIGVAHVDSVPPREFTQDEIRLLQVLADRAAVVIDNARLFARERELREQTARFADEASTLREVAEALVGSISLSERLATLASNFVRATSASRCVILLREADNLIPQAVYGFPRRVQQLLLRQTFDLDDAGPALRRILAEGRAAVVRDADAEALLPSGVAQRWLIRCALVVPLQFGGRVTGVVGLDTPGCDRDVSDEQVRLVRALAHQAAAAIETGKTYEAERNIARILQESFLSRATTVPHFEVASRYDPASAVAQIGGDYFDFIELSPGRLGIVMGDVCGKGLTAAVYTAMAKYILRAYAMEDVSPAGVVTRLNRALHNQMSEECMFITLVYGVLDHATGRFTYTNAAHPPPLLYRTDRDRFEELVTTGGMVGAIQEMEYGEATVELRRDDVLALYTDGVTEARTDGAMLEQEGVCEVLRATARSTARRVADAVYNRALEASAGQLKDDVAIVVIRAREPGGD